MRNPATSIKNNPTARAIFRYNAGRDPERLAMKYAKMARNPFIFLRGACHLFYDSLPDSDLFSRAPLAWCCGDLHFENFGSYKGDNRLVYFDINDFDEAALAPATWDMLRLMTSIICGAELLGASPRQAHILAGWCADAWRDALLKGKPMWVERDTSSGLVHDLFESLERRDRARFLDTRSERRGRRRYLRVDGQKALPASAAQKKAVTAFMQRFAATQPEPKFFRVLDIARRVAGTGSLGLERYVILIEGKGSPDGNYLMDLKQCNPSALLPRLAQLRIAQPRWGGEAERVIGVQRRLQAVDNAFLHAVKMGGKPYQLRELQPSEDRVEPSRRNGLKDLAATMGRVLAWDQLRSAGRSGSDSADALAALAGRRRLTGELLEGAREMVAVTTQQWHAFSAALRDGALDSD